MIEHPTDNDFFPSEDYKIPTTSNYMKLGQGANRFRVLSSAIIGWEYWNKENVPIRSRQEFEGVPRDIRADSRVNHFWAFLVWNYDAKRVQVLELTQKSIMTAIKALIENPEWGSPKMYDIVINKKGTTKNDTEYSVVPSPHKPLDPSVSEQFNGMRINLDALYEGLDPFTVDKN